MQPFDYRLAVQNPVQMALAGYQQGREFVGQREEAAMNRELFALKKQEFEANQAKLAQEQARAKEVQAVLADYAEKFRNNNVTADDAAYVMNFAPELAEQIQASWTMKSDAQKEATKKEVVRLGAALRFSPEVAMGIVNDRITALRENGNPEDLAAAESIKGYLDMGMPEAALSALSLYANNVMKPEEWEAFSNIIMPKRPEAVGEIGGIIQNWQNGLYLDFYGTEEKAREMAEADMKAVREGKPLVTNILGGEETAFERESGALQAKNIAAIMESGQTARRNQQTLNALQSAMGNAQTGGVAAVKKFLGDLGVATEGLDDIQAFNALISRLVPAQRPPGSGEMSNADLKLFADSLPRLINQPGGNEKIIKTMMEINEYLIREGEIAEMVLDGPENGGITRAEGRRRMRELGNPLANIGKAETNDGYPRITSDEEYDKLPMGTLYRDDEGILREKN